MKVAIFGYPRAGTTMLHYIITQHLVSAGAVKEWADLGEVFNPMRGSMLSVQSGHLVNRIDAASPEVHSREDRLLLFKQHIDDDYIIKYMPYDITNPDTVKTVVGARYKFIAIERRNPLSAYLSVIIAYHHRVWHILDEANRPVYEPFVASEEEIKGLGISMSLYHRYRDYFNPSVVLYYEDIVAQASSETLKRAGVYQEGALVSEAPTKKIHSFEDKIKLIINLEDVIEHLTGILLPYDVTMEHNDL